jgi:CRP-like cAMP-binding protein
MFVLETGKVTVLKSWRGQDYLLQTLKEGDCFGEMAVMDYCPRSASVRAVEDCIAIRISAANLYEVYAQDLKQFSLIQMNMGREVCRRLREADNRLFGARMGAPDADIGQRNSNRDPAIPARLVSDRVGSPGRLNNAGPRFAENKAFRPAMPAWLARLLMGEVPSLVPRGGEQN